MRVCPGSKTELAPELPSAGRVRSFLMSLAIDGPQGMIEYLWLNQLIDDHRSTWGSPVFYLDFSTTWVDV